VTALSVAPVAINWNPRLPIFAAEAFLKTVAGEYGWMGGISESGELRCILPYTVVRKPGVRMVRFRLETTPWQGELDQAEELSFLESVIQHFRSSDADMVIPSGNTALFRTYPAGALAAPYGTFVNDLTQTEDALMGAIRKTYRNNIRRAEKAGVQIQSGPEYFDASYQLIADTLKRSRVSFKSYDEFQRTIASLGENLKIFVAEHEGIVQGCLVSPFSRHSAYNWYCGSRPEPVLGSMHLLHWEAMRQFRALGVQRFNFQGVRIDPEKGSKQEGIMNYKKGFGGALVQGYMWKYRFHALKWAAYSIAVRLLQGGDVVDQERAKLVTHS
jgi:lipid II:glycine glycyltransferase (peptidoglycan interpeptide bridge formation enzyme)